MHDSLRACLCETCGLDYRAGARNDTPITPWPSAPKTFVMRAIRIQIVFGSKSQPLVDLAHYVDERIALLGDETDPPCACCSCVYMRAIRLRYWSARLLNSFRFAGRPYHCDSRPRRKSPQQHRAVHGVRVADARSPSERLCFACFRPDGPTGLDGQRSRRCDHQFGQRRHKRTGNLHRGDFWSGDSISFQYGQLRSDHCNRNDKLSMNRSEAEREAVETTVELA